MDRYVSGASLLDASGPRCLGRRRNDSPAT